MQQLVRDRDRAGIPSPCTRDSLPSSFSVISVLAPESECRIRMHRLRIDGHRHAFRRFALPGAVDDGRNPPDARRRRASFLPRLSLFTLRVLLPYDLSFTLRFRFRFVFTFVQVAVAELNTTESALEA